MAEPFDCPKCGAPISFQPHPGDETVECPYCHETVIIPEDLRIPLPRPVVIRQPAAKPAKPLNWVLIAVVLVICIGASVAAFLIANTHDQSSLDIPTDTPAVSAADSATATRS